MPNLPKQPRPTNKQAIRQAWADEHTAARQARSAGDTAGEWGHLERAHILSQPLAVAHVRTHLAMLGYGIRHRDRREIAGQLLRLLVAGPGSALGATRSATPAAPTSAPSRRCRSPPTSKPCSTAPSRWRRDRDRRTHRPRVDDDPSTQLGCRLRCGPSRRRDGVLVARTVDRSRPDGHA